MAYHILNGDALREQFPDGLKGERITMRECLVEGPLEGDSLAEFFATREAFIEAHYGDVAPEGYQGLVVREIEKILAIPPRSKVYLWFEDDLFCQVNWWFVTSLLHGQGHDLRLVRPHKLTPYGFGAFTPEGLGDLLAQSTPMRYDADVAQLWWHYKNGDTDRLQQTAKFLTAHHPFVAPAVEAHLARIPKDGQPGRPVVALKQIMADLGTDEFAPVFQEFCKRESIYGFGDLQVKRLFDGIVEG